jgi:alanyl-tRNA synthetase
VTIEVARERGMTVDEVGFRKKLAEHQVKSRAGAEQKFKGGLADHSDMVVKYHTATHLLHRALHIVLGEHATQKGSNITSERLRFDFAHPTKVTPEEVVQIEKIINGVIAKDLPVLFEDVSRDEAEKRGARGLFGEKYGDIVRIYEVGKGDERFSIEFCGGPHVERTGILGRFRITKEEASSQGVRRIKAVLE